ncbi:DNA mismatch repair endonuclease MutL [Saccharobesus litoralis]|uniref:DNA mismatch repair protein MutL n=1 Tax=Saccharobesus litoralis TaxID=2172099 RepID=A0A2S0VWF1_9ALTE|nr:DNA mismatch repair endonuclease MutL [Saccharobesus litoralis]AWB68503.1 DNA mismatch repair endonuclease MutL [Saccharobesus litoralis]
MPIKILPPQLANQIAAGEVVERPASVIKELLENSLDAGATKIDIDIEAGGSQLIRIRDNGSGIAKEELGLALSRHATSKVSSLNDLEAIQSLGFRGEALASISSVSRLKLTSRPEHQTEAWQATAEGQEMAVDIKPAAHPVGTTIEVADLFFNTPARRRFLRTDKTEFTHIEEVIKRIALSRFDVQIKLTNNGKIHKNYRTGREDKAQLQRIAAVCGGNFIEHCVELDSSYDLVTIKGWLGEPHIARQQRDIQYCYVNGRMMRDKLINHAIRQAYESRITSEQHAAYVLYIEVDPKQVDVNVHPAKHEVRFHQARLIHDFIYQAVYAALNNELVDNAIAEATLVQQSSGQQSLVQQNKLDTGYQAGQLYPGQEVASQFERELADSTLPNSSATSSSSEPSLNLERNIDGDKVAPSAQGSASYANSPYTNHANHTNSSNRPSHGNSAQWQSEYSPKTSVSTEQQIAHYAELVAPLSDTKALDKTSASSPAEPLDAAESTNIKTNINIKASSQLSDVQILTTLQQHYLLAKYADNLYCLPIAQLQLAIIGAKLEYVCNQPDAIAQPLLLPVAIKVDQTCLNKWLVHQTCLTQLQFVINQPRKDTLVIQKVPALLRELDLASIIGDWLLQLPEQDTPISTDHSIKLLANLVQQQQNLPSWSEITQLLNDYHNLKLPDFATFIKQHAKQIDYSHCLLSAPT